MACYKLTSCTAGDTTVIYTNSNLAAYVGISVEISLYLPGQKCFTVELSDPPCNCTSPIGVTVTLPDCICNTPYTCYKLVDCTDINNFFYTTTNLNAYVGTSVSVFEQPGHCWDVIGIADPVECDTNLPITEPVTCAAPCTCAPVFYCYEIQNCAVPTAIFVINTTSILVNLTVISISPNIIVPGGNNCWTVLGPVVPCVQGTGTPVTVLNDFGIGQCSLCAGPLVCYELAPCDGSPSQYTQSNLAAFVNMYIQTTFFPGVCFFVTVSPVVCPAPVVIDNGTVTTCVCPCYSLLNCRTREVINSNSNLLTSVGFSVYLDEYGGCQGDCWQVSVNNGPCDNPLPVMVTVTLGCVPCGPCDQTCFELVDCETDVVYITVLNPTVNGINLATLISGQAIGQICVEGLPCVFGCWYVRATQNCSAAVPVSVFTVYPPSPTQDGCEQCLNSCYGLLNCQTLEIEYIIKYTVPNPNPLIPNPATITGSIGNLCFTPGEGGCITGCFIFQLIPNVQCDDPIDWTEVVSYDSFDDCDDCLPKCYLLTECAPAVSDPFVVNNDLSLYVGNIAKICDSQGVCHCYSVERAQSCDGAITIDNANASFITCEDCNSCDCPPGYTKIGDNCQKITTVPATTNPTIYSTGPGSINALYGNLGTRFYNNITALPYPLTAVTGPDRMVDAALVTVPQVTNITGVWGGPAGSRLNTIGIWTTVPPNPVLQWIGFAECINIETSGTYCIGIAGDDQIRMKIDGVLAATIGIGFFDFNYWHVFEITLTAGTHVITLEGNNNGGPAAFAAEIYNATSATLQTFTTAAQVQGVTVFSTFPKRTSGTFQTGETSGFSCPPGYALDLCDGAPSCSLIETIPFVPCPRTFRVTDCEGEETPFLTNTDLSSYIGGTYKTCIPEIDYSTTCFVLKDCNRLVADIVTNTTLGGFLWQTVSLEGYPGSCFIVTGVPSGQICVGAIPVIVLEPTQQSCPCEGAQLPWFPRCYCVTVEEVFPTIIAPNFEGIFIDIAYECCDDCLQVCYLLTACLGGINPVVVCNDLAQYVGQVIQIASCGDICWQVAVSANCVGSTLFSGLITAYDNCVDCLPPVPPTPPPFDLHLRKIKPGWKSPNKCYTLDYIERINCSFGQQVYNQMLVARYGITVCCDDDLTKWDIKKQMLDLDMLKDPNLCKSTLCCCPAPCLIDAVIALLPFCGAPNIVSVVLNQPCPAPVLIGVDIDVEVIPALCYCWKVDYATEGPLTIVYIDCCCVVQTQIIDLAGEGSIPICSITAPVSYNNDITSVTNQGLCGEALLCNPPPPQICSCWRISNPSSQPGNFAVDQICPCPPPFLCVGILGTLNPLSPPAYFCSIAPPLADGNLVVTNLGDCDGYCGPTPPACVCYHVTAQDPGITCEFTYTDCDGNPQVVVPPMPLNYYICSQSYPLLNAACNPSDFSITPTPFPCVPGPGGSVCGPPLPCICYNVQISGLVMGGTVDYFYYDCNYVLQSVLGATDGIYAICATSVPSSADAGFTVVSTPQDCALGECIAPYSACFCYEIVLPPDGVGYTIHQVACNGTPFDEVLINNGTTPLFRRCAQLTPTCPALPPGSITISPLNCGLGECVDPPLPVPCNCYRYQVAGTPGGPPQFQDIVDCTGSPNQIGGLPGLIGYACIQSFGIFNPLVLVTSIAPGDPNCALIGC